ncbi:hypothetical protein FisN_11Hh112 [Fistulifera solaris]|uniref:Uncharacterized protein n=1 Tax=Fistulifera solaris TaxID=1519565 RepID=A0A1Z5JKA9_FISSO|nr:hypothetical protein FisN_11Hh112 [Fistulifera solaris]|eukprot:GAX14429.1 hypothetical protein FisN_11Hh112 [Fistulifera solaris]
MSDWTKVPVRSTNGDSADNFLLVSNPSFTVPDGLTMVSDFISPSEESELLEAIDDKNYSWEGFEQRRKVQRFTFNDKASTLSDMFYTLRDKIKEKSGWQATHLAIEEYNVDKVAFSGEFSSNYKVTTFESPAPGDPSCFVAQIPLRKAAVQHLNKPKERQVACWNLESPNHCSDVFMPRGSLLLKSRECLGEWRSRTAASRDTDDCVTLLKFYSLSSEALDSSNHAINHQNGSDMNSFGYVPSPNDNVPSPDEAMPPLEDLLTIIVTTSPIRSNPSTEVLERAMETFVFGGTDFAYQCRKVIVCDGVRKKEDEAPTKSYSNVKQALRNGIVSNEQDENYTIFKQRLRQLCQEAPVNSPFHNTHVEELSERQGYGFALRHALRHCVSTPYVCVIQHDRTFMRPTPIRETMEAMWRNRFIKYVGMSMRSNLFYRDIFLAKYGRIYHEEFKRLIVRVPELLVKKECYGPDSASTREMNLRSEILRENILALAKSYPTSAQGTIEQDWCRQNPVPEEMHQLSLTPTLFWYDNVHICETEHYRDFVFKPSYKMVAKGGFVEDKLSPVLLRTVERLGLSDGHSRFGCYILDDHSGMFFTGHLDGGSYMTDELRKAMKGKSSSSS